MLATSGELGHPPNVVESPLLRMKGGRLHPIKLVVSPMAVNPTCIGIFKLKKLHSSISTILRSLKTVKNPLIRPLLGFGDATRAKRAFDLFAKASRINVGGPIIYNPITKKTNYTSDSEEEALIAAALFGGYREVAFGGPEGAGQRLFGFKTYLSILRGAIPYLADKDTSEQAMKILANFSMQMYSDKDAAWWMDKFETSRLRKLLDGDPSWKFDADP